MSLFKISKGQSENLKNVNIQDGHLYFSVDDGKLYIDIGENGSVPLIGNYCDQPVGIDSDGKILRANRICVNQRVFSPLDYDILDCGDASGNIEPAGNVIIFDCNKQ